MKKLTLLTLFMTLAITNVFADEIEPITPPTDLQTEKYMLTVVRKDDGTTEYQQAAVGFYGESEVYIQGLSQSSQKGWVKGTLSGTTLTIPECIMGTNEGEWITIIIQFNGATFEYDKDKNTFTCANGYTTKNINGAGGGEAYTSATLAKINEHAATPATPSCKLERPTATLWELDLVIPLKDVDGNPISEDNLSKIVWIRKDGVDSKLTFTKDIYKGITEDITEIPYNFRDTKYDFSPWTIYLNQGEAVIKSWSHIGLQSIYRYNDEVNVSEIGWYESPYHTTAIQNVNAGAANRSGKIYNLNGQEMQSLKRGLNIVNGKKVFVK